MLTSACNKVIQLYQRSAALIINTGHPPKRLISLARRGNLRHGKHGRLQKNRGDTDQSGDYSLVFDGQYKRIISAI